MTLFLALVLAHVVADFLLQPSQWTTGRGRTLPARLAHGGIVALVAALAIIVTQALQPTLALSPLLIVGLSLLIGALHAAQDLVVERGDTGDRPGMGALRRFLLDQFAHVLALAIVTVMVVPVKELVAPIYENVAGCIGATAFDRWLAAAIATVAGTVGTGVAIRKFLEPFAEQAKDALHQETPNETAAAADIQATAPTWVRHSLADTAASDGLEVAGYWIGMLERAMLILAIAAGGDTATAAGFLVAFKSIYRFKSLDDRRKAEYYLLGTLASVTVAIVVGIAVRALLTGVCGSA